MSAYRSVGQCLSFSAELNLTSPFFDMYLYFTAYEENKEIMNSNKDIYIVFYRLRLYVT